MSELVQDPELVAVDEFTRTNTVKAGEDIIAGMPVWSDEDDDDMYWRSKADHLATAKINGIAVNNASRGQPLEILDTANALINLGAVLYPGEVYMVSAATAGKIVPVGDYVDDVFPVLLGLAISEDELRYTPNEAEIALGGPPPSS